MILQAGLNSAMNPSHTLTTDLGAPEPDDFQAIGPAFRVLQLNVEGLSAVKRTLISSLAHLHEADVICLQETHVPDLTAGRYSISGYDLIKASPDAKFGRATYVRSTITDASPVTSDKFCDVVQVGDFAIANVYKPPSVEWSKNLLPTLQHPALFVGDFNSHHPDWGYGDMNEDGERLAEWAMYHDLVSTFDAKQRGTFHSARWKKDYTPDLCWASSDGDHHQTITHTILDDFPRSQHRPSLIHIGLKLPIIHCAPRLRWNFRRADWKMFSNTLEKSVVTIPKRSISIQEAYDRFRRAIFSAASVSIPRGYRPVYTPCLDKKCQALLKEYEESGDPDVADLLIDTLDLNRRERWEQCTSSLDFTRSSRKSWSLIRRLGAAQRPATAARPQVSPNAVASHLIKVAKAPLERQQQQQVRDEWRQYSRSQKNPSDCFEAFTVSELQTVLQSIKSGTAAGYDNILTEFLKHVGPAASTWLVSFYTRVVTERRIPREWLQAKVIAIPKPGKDPKEAASYRPISLLSVCYKTLERLILQRISPILDDHIVVEQAGFRRGRSTCDQVLALTTYIENGFQNNLKTGAVFLDLTAAFDTVWHAGLLVKVSRAFPPWFTAIIQVFLRNRRFRVHLGDSVSSWRTQVNGLPQGSVLSPCLFNIYINDLPATQSRKFAYADDIALGAQRKTLEQLEECLNEDVEKMEKFLKKWRLQPSAAKTVSCVFHLHNAQASRELNIHLNGQRIRHDPHPVYLGVTLDRSLTYREHLKKTAAKVGTRNNLLSKLAGTDWGAHAPTLRSAALALCFSTAEYCSPVWARSNHTNLVDVRLNASMRIVSGTLRPTPLPWLPVLSNILPPHLRRLEATAKQLGKARSNDSLPLQRDILLHPAMRLPSRRPIWLDPPAEDMTANSAWSAEWSATDAANHSLVAVPSVWPPGYNLSRRLWTTLNRFRTGQGRCAANQVRWKQASNPLCDCGEVQTMYHIVNDCRITGFPGGLSALHIADDDAVRWLSANCKR